MVILYLFITFVFAWILVVYLFDRDWYSPAVLITSGYTLSIAIAFISDFFVPFNYSWVTYVILVVGMVMYILPAYIFKLSTGGKIYEESKFFYPIEISKKILWLHAFLSLSVVLLTVEIYSQFLSAVGEDTSLLSAIAGMRRFGIEHPEGLDFPLITVVNQLRKIFLTTGYLILVIFVRNCVLKRRFNQDNLLLFNCLCCISLIMTGGGRGNIVEYLLAGVVIYFVYRQIFFGTGKLNFTIKSITILLCTFIIGCVFFYLSLWITGRGNNEFNIMNMVHHTSFYLGGSIPLLDNFLETYNINNEINFGKETFYAAIQQIRKLGLLDIPPYSINLEFRPGVYDGNVYTAFRSYISDFGYIGILIAPIVFAFLSSWLYYKAIHSGQKQNISVCMAMYAIMVYPIFTDFIRGFFLMSFFSIDLIIQITILMLSKKLLMISSRTN